MHTSWATPCRPCPPQPLVLAGTITGPGTGPMFCSLSFQTCYPGQHSVPSFISLTQLQGTSGATKRQCRQVWLDQTEHPSIPNRAHSKAHHHPFFDTKNILNPFSQQAIQITIKVPILEWRRDYNPQQDHHEGDS